MNILLFPLFLLSMNDTPRLPVIKPAPDFALQDSAGKSIRLADLRGKVVLVSFIFTTCNGSCPATTHRLAKVHESLNQRGLLKDKVRFVSITLDPERDRPEVLRDYKRLFEIEGDSWHFLTGSPAEVKKVHAAWDMWARPGANGQLDHPSRIFLVDGHARIREIYNLEFLRTPWVIEDIEALLKEE